LWLILPHPENQSLLVIHYGGYGMLRKLKIKINKPNQGRRFSHFGCLSFLSQRHHAVSSIGWPRSFDVRESGGGCLGWRSP
jgi:hypothetical protein